MQEDWKKKRVLLVEDDEFLGDLLSVKFSEGGLNFELAKDGEIAVERAREEIPELILLDILLPGMNGFEVLKALKEDATTKDVPVIILSNLGQQSEIKEGLELGASDFLIKANYEPSEILERVEHILQKL